MPSFTLRQRLEARSPSAEVVTSPVTATATSLAARFPSVHSIDASFARACGRRQQQALDVLAKAHHVEPNRAKHVLAKAGANLAGGLAAGQVYRVIGRRRDQWLGLVPKELVRQTDPSAKAHSKQLLERLQAAVHGTERTPLVATAAANPAKAASLHAIWLVAPARRAAAAGQHAVQVSLAVGMSSSACAVAVPSGLTAAVSAYLFLRLCLHLQTDEESRRWLTTLHTITEAYQLPFSQLPWLRAHEPAAAKP